MAVEHDQAEHQRKLFQLVWGYATAQVVGVAARWKIVDRIGDAERGSEELADELDCPHRTTLRLLRAMAALGLLSENSPGRFTVAPLGAPLRSDQPGSMYGLARMFTDPVMWRAWGDLDHSVHTGQIAFDRIFGTDYFSHLKTDPELSALFNTAMSEATSRAAPVVAKSYDFGRFGTVMDVGGGAGTLLGAILAEHPGLRGILFDSAEGAAEAPETLAKVGVVDRCDISTGDFFAEVPAGADAYLLKSIVHDWDDEKAGTILTNCRRAMPADGRLLIVEPVLPEVVDPDTGSPVIYLSDLNMLVNLGGMERTLPEFALLCDGAGFTIRDTVELPNPIGFTIIEAAPK